MSATYTNAGTNASTNACITRSVADNGVKTSGRVKKTRMREQLYSIIEGLSESQTNLLLMQAQNLSGGKGRNIQTNSIQSLSKRELEVLVLVANGYNRKSIGSTLGISVNTAARHIANIYSKLGISTVAEATSYAYNSNVIGGVQGSQQNVAEWRA